MYLGQLIKKFREDNDLSMDDFAAMSGLSKGYISMLERNKRSGTNKPIAPTMDTFRAVARGMRTDVDALLNALDPDTPVSLAPSFRINREFDRLVDAAVNLNEVGQGKVADYAEDLVNSGMYIAEDGVSDPYVDFTIGAAAAGQGVHYGDEIRNYRTFMVTEVPEHDISIDVTGNSMWPTIYDGDVVFVRKAYDKHDGGIYVLDIDGETVIKRVYFDDDSIRLVSDNPEFDDRTVSGYELEQTRVVGEVVGWETPVK